MNWIDCGEYETRPVVYKHVLCYCPKWNDSGYQVAYWDGTTWQYDEDPNGTFSKYVEAWVLFMEAD
jgi:hypothetical protein